MIAAGVHIFPVKILFIFIAAVSARSSAMSLNRILGLRYDKNNPRKKEWSLVTGKIKLRSAVLMTIFFIAVFEISAYMLNTFVLLLSPAVIFLFLSDPVLKRYTVWRHLYMGSAIGIGVLAGYLSVIPAFPSDPPIYLIFLATSFWIGGFDMIYVLPDVEFDRANGLKTVMVKYGIRKGLQISDMFHAITLGSLYALLLYFPSVWYAGALIPITFLVIYQHVIVNPTDVNSVRNSFFRPNSFIGFIFLVAIILTFAVPVSI